MRRIPETKFIANFMKLAVKQVTLIAEIFMLPGCSFGNILMKK